jgi:hypothetical protein
VAGSAAIPLYVAASLLTALIAWVQLRGPRALLPLTVSAAIVAVSFVLIFSVLIPLTAEKSAKEVVRAIPAQGAVVASYGGYPTSAVFYSGHTVTRLVLRPESLTPQGAWAGKHTMPTETVASFEARTAGNPEAYLLLIKRNAPPLEGFSPVMSLGKTTLYKRDVK